MGRATMATGHLPYVIPEPREVAGGGTDGSDSRSFLEAYDPENLSNGIEEGVFVPAAHTDSPAASCDDVTAIGTVDFIVFLIPEVNVDFRVGNDL